MKRLLFILCLIASVFGMRAQEAKNEINFEKEEEMRTEMRNIYEFSVTYRIQGSYLQQWQHSSSNSFADMHLYGPEVGVVFDFNLPYNFSIETGVLYGLTYGTSSQHWKNMSSESYEEQYIKHRILSHQLSVPVFVTYNIKLWQKLSLILYTGPEVSVGIAQKDYMNTTLNDVTKQWLEKNSVKTEPYERYKENEILRTNIQYDLGGGLQWDRYRLTGGYKFGLNNLAKQNKEISQHMWNWSINVSLSYAF